MQVRTIIDKLYNTTNASREELLFLLNNLSDENKEYLIEKSHKVALKNCSSRRRRSVFYWWKNGWNNKKDKRKISQ